MEQASCTVWSVGAEIIFALCVQSTFITKWNCKKVSDINAIEIDKTYVHQNHQNKRYYRICIGKGTVCPSKWFPFQKSLKLKIKSVIREVTTLVYIIWFCRSSRSASLEILIKVC